MTPPIKLSEIPHLDKLVERGGSVLVPATEIVAQNAELERLRAQNDALWRELGKADDRIAELREMLAARGQAGGLREYPYEMARLVVIICDYVYDFSFGQRDFADRRSIIAKEENMQSPNDNLELREYISVLEKVIEDKSRTIQGQETELINLRVWARRALFLIENEFPDSDVAKEAPAEVR